jgi:RNA-directed DNA polymerase
MTLDGLEQTIKNHIKRKLRLSTLRVQIQIVRYADDFLVTGPDITKFPWVWNNHIIPIIKEFLKVRGLELNSIKSVITPVTEPITFLGFTLRLVFSQKTGKKWILLIRPSARSVLRLRHKINLLFKDINITSGRLLLKINSISLLKKRMIELLCVCKC